MKIRNLTRLTEIDLNSPFRPSYLRYKFWKSDKGKSKHLKILDYREKQHNSSSNKESFKTSFTMFIYCYKGPFLYTWKQNTAVITWNYFALKFTFEDGYNTISNVNPLTFPTIHRPERLFIVLPVEQSTNSELCIRWGANFNEAIITTISFYMT